MQWNPGARPQEDRARPYRGVLEAIQERVRPYIESRPEHTRAAYGSVLQTGAEMLPGLGDVVAVEDLQGAAQDGDWVGMGMGLLAAVPGIPSIRGATKGAGRGGRARRGLLEPSTPGLLGDAPRQTNAEAALARYRAANPDDTGARVLNPGDEGYPHNAQWDEASQAYVAPRLQSAITYNGQTYTGATHLDAIAAIPDPLDRIRATADGNNRVFVDETGRVLDRRKAQRYAVEHNLFADDAPSWAATAPELNSESLRRQAPVEPDYPIRAFHGSPHSFDRFSLDKIGTGEGAQVFGHGLYFAESEDVARGYRDTLSRQVTMGDQVLYDGRTRLRPGSTGPQELDSALGNNEWDIGRAVADIERDLADLPADHWRRKYLEAGLERGREIQAADSIKVTNPGSMYEVGINAHPDTFLDWDRPLSEQPESVRAAVDDILANVPGVRDNLQPVEANRDGRSLLGAFSEALPYGDNYSAALTNELRQRGVPGIRYLDGNSRGVGEGSSNYVVFNDELVKILRKYGISGLGLGLGINALSGEQPEAGPNALSGPEYEYQGTALNPL